MKNPKDIRSRIQTGGTLLAGAGRGGSHENKKRPDPKKDRKRWKQKGW